MSISNFYFFVILFFSSVNHKNFTSGQTDLDTNFEDGSTGLWKMEKSCLSEARWMVEELFDPFEVNNSVPSNNKTGIRHLRILRSSSFGVACLRSPVMKFQPGDQIAFDYWLRSRHPHFNNIQLFLSTEDNEKSGSFSERLLLEVFPTSRPQNSKWRSISRTIVPNNGTASEGSLVFYGFCGMDSFDAVALDNILILYNSTSSSTLGPINGKTTTITSNIPGNIVSTLPFDSTSQTSTETATSITEDDPTTVEEMRSSTCDGTDCHTINTLFPVTDEPLPEGTMTTGGLVKTTFETSVSKTESSMPNTNISSTNFGNASVPTGIPSETTAPTKQTTKDDTTPSTSHEENTSNFENTSDDSFSSTTQSTADYTGKTDSVSWLSTNSRLDSSTTTASGSEEPSISSSTIDPKTTTSEGSTMPESFGSSPTSTPPLNNNSSTSSTPDVSMSTYINSSMTSLATGTTKFETGTNYPSSQTDSSDTTSAQTSQTYTSTGVSNITPFPTSSLPELTDATRYTGGSIAQSSVSMGSIISSTTPESVTSQNSTMTYTTFTGDKTTLSPSSTLEVTESQSIPGSSGEPEATTESSDSNSSTTQETLTESSITATRSTNTLTSRDISSTLEGDNPTTPPESTVTLSTIGGSSPTTPATTVSPNPGSPTTLQSSTSPNIGKTTTISTVTNGNTSSPVTTSTLESDSSATTRGFTDHTTSSIEGGSSQTAPIPTASSSSSSSATSQSTTLAYSNTYTATDGTTWLSTPGTHPSGTTISKTPDTSTPTSNGGSSSLSSNSSTGFMKTTTTETIKTDIPPPTENPCETFVCSDMDNGLYLAGPCCSYYFVCDNGKLVCMKCPESLVFDGTRCEYEDLVEGCQNGPNCNRKDFHWIF